MSGNPFRRQQPAAATAAPAPAPASSQAFDSSDAESRFPALHDDSSEAEEQQQQQRRPAKAKRVRIETPPPLSPDPETPLQSQFSPEPIYQVAHESHTGSPPPPPVLQGDSVTEYNPFDRGFNALAQTRSEQVLENTRRNSGSGDATPALPSPDLLRSGAPSNPFARTLATMEPGEVEPGRGSTGSSSGGGGGSGGSKKEGAMGVDDFAKMLLTGRGPSSTSALESTAAAVPTQAPQQQEHDASLDTPPSSGEDYSSGSDDTETAAEPTQQPQEASASQTERQKPPLPVHKHGKVVAGRKPQTVSFDDFEDTPAPTPAPAPTASSARAPRSSGKALPPPPPTARRTTAEGSIHSKSSSTSLRDSSATQEPGVAKAASAPLAQVPVPKTGKAPPPPPTRRAGNRSSMYEPGAVTPTSSLEAAMTLPAEDAPAHSRRALAEALQQHQQGAPSTSRSSSRSSRPNAPPPPPQRRRGSSKSSVDLQPRTSQDSTRPASSSFDKSARAGPPTAAAAGDHDDDDADAAGQQRDTVLANLDALQAEVDALRLKYGRAG